MIFFFLTDWLPFTENGGGVGSIEIGSPRSKKWKNFGCRWRRGWGVLKIGQCSWTSYVYHP